MILGCVQPSYLAWIPLFERMKMSDVFVHLDDAQYSKNSYHNRNRIKAANGEVTLTVPVLYSGSSGALINQIKTDDSKPWRKKHLRTIQMAYSKAPHRDDLISPVQDILTQDWQSLADLNIAFIEMLKDYLGIDVPTYRSSELNVKGKANEKLVNICKKLGADKFVVKPGTEDYHPRGYFEPHGIGFAYFDPDVRTYSQIHGDFIPRLSILDYAMNCGANSFNL